VMFKRSIIFRKLRTDACTVQLRQSVGYVTTPYVESDDSVASEDRV
jgi:hypothetical protein